MSFNPNKSKSVFQETATLNLFDPDTKEELEVDGKPVSITVMGQANPKYLKAVEVLRAADDKRKGRKATLAESRADSVNFLASISVSSDNLVDDSDEPVLTKEQFKELYDNDKISWIREQVSTFAGEPTSFLPK